MHGLRRLVLTYRAVALALLVVAMALRLLVPAGFMPSMADGRLAIVLCPGTAPPPAAAAHHAAPGTAHHAPDEQARADAPCAFAGLGLAALSGAPPMPAATAILFALLLAIRGRIGPPAPRLLRLRPPLRAPPTPA